MRTRSSSLVASLLLGVLAVGCRQTISNTISPDQIDPANPVVYSPLAISGLAIGFNVERIPLPNAGAAFDDVRGQRIARLNLTPRLVAKLLTQSYRAAVTYVSKAPTYTWLPGNPLDLALDPDPVIAAVDEIVRAVPARR